MGGFFKTISYCFRNYFRHVQDDRRRFLLMLFLVLGVVASNTAMIWYVGVPFGQIQQGHFSAVGTTILVLVAIAVVNQLFHFSSLTLVNWLGLRYVGRLRKAVIQQLMWLEYPRAEQWSKGDLLARTSNDVDRVQSLIVEMPSYLVSHLLTLVFYVGALLWIDIDLALWAALCIPFFIVHQLLFNYPKRRASETFFRRNGRLLAFEEQVLSFLRGISTNNAQGRMAQRHGEVFDQARRAAMRMRWLDNGFNASLSLIIFLCGFYIVYSGVQRVEQGVMGLGQLVSFILYLGYISVPIRGLTQIPMQAQESFAAVQRLDQLFTTLPLVARLESPNQSKLLTTGDICFDQVHFSYPNGKSIFNGLDLNIHAGETVALVGPSGCGKSTLSQLLLRFFEPNAGRITIAQQDLRTIDPSIVRHSIAMVWQEPFLLDATVRENLLLTSEMASDADIWRALELAHAKTFVLALPQGLDTPLGSGGVTLSTGQRQRLAIAQAFLRDTPILVLDEASSALDSESEQHIVNALAQLRRGRTTLMIAHRYSSIRGADRVVYFCGDGKVVTGNHEQLLERQDGYREAVNWQTLPVVDSTLE